MSQTNKPAPVWTKPELIRLGTIKDVAGSAPGNVQTPTSTGVFTRS
jgi:hypothetical protein